MNKKYCSLTFDDGPNFAGDNTMNRMLDILEKHGVVASFFLIANKISDEKLQNRCIMLGKHSQSELPSIYAASDCFLLASDYEILGMVIMEAMYFGVPVISTKTTGADFIIKDGEDGIIIDNKDAKIWANTIVRILSDNRARKQIGEAGKKKVMNRFLWDKTCEGFLNLYFG